MYIVYENGSFAKCKDVARLRRKKLEYDFWLDLEQMEAAEKELGAIDLFAKRVLGRLLCFLVMNAGKTYTADELYPPVWCLGFSDLSGEVTVRASISRLRKLIEPHPPHWKYLKKEPSTFLSPRGAYYFDPRSNYCLIRKADTQLFDL